MCGCAAAVGIADLFDAGGASLASKAAAAGMYGSCLVGFAPRLPLVLINGAMCAFAALCLAAPVGAGVTDFAILSEHSPFTDYAYGEPRAVAGVCVYTLCNGV